MAIKNHPVIENKKQETPLEKEKRKEAKIKMFIQIYSALQMLDIKSDMNMKRFYSALQSIKQE